MAKQSTSNDPQEDLLAMPHSRAEPSANAFDILDGTLLHSLKTIKVRDLSFRRESPASSMATYYIFLEPTADDQAIWLGKIELRKIQSEVTDVRIERWATGKRAVLFEEVVSHWKTYIEFNKEVSKEILGRSEKQVDAKPEIRHTTQGHPLPPIYEENLLKVKELSLLPLTVKQIALRLAISEATVKRYRKKLGLQRRKK